MKKMLFQFMLLVLSITIVHGQKLYSTRTGQMKFNASGGVEKIAAVNNQVDSKMIDKTGQIVFSVLIKGFKFDNQLMEDHFNENYLESTKYPKADFKGYISNISQVNFTTDGKYNITAEGTLTIHGVSQKITVQGIMIISHGTPSINGSFKIKIKEYGITGLYIGDKIANEAEIALSVSY